MNTSFSAGQSNHTVLDHHHSVLKEYNVNSTNFEEGPNPSHLLAVCPWASIQLTPTLLDKPCFFPLFHVFSQLESLCRL